MSKNNTLGIRLGEGFGAQPKRFLTRIRHPPPPKYAELRGHGRKRLNLCVYLQGSGMQRGD